MHKRSQSRPAQKSSAGVEALSGVHDAPRVHGVSIISFGHAGNDIQQNVRFFAADLAAPVHIAKEPPLTTTTTRWSLDVISHGDHLTDAAMQGTSDMNEAKSLVHEVLSRALHRIGTPVSRSALDTDMGIALQRRASRLEDIGRSPQ